MTWTDVLVVALGVVLGPVMVLIGCSFYRLNRAPMPCPKLGPTGVVASAGVFVLGGVGILAQAAVRVLLRVTA